MERKLASIQIIDDVQPIPDADQIECLHVLGWAVVARKGEFKKGDKCIYCEVDSVLPEREEFEYMRPMKFRVRTLKLRGQLSQGVCFKPAAFDMDDLAVGTDVTALLGITKYERPVKLMSVGGGNSKPAIPRPPFVPKTDEYRLQSYPQLIDEFMGKECYITTKLDGTSMSVFWWNGQFGVCSRNRLAEAEEMYWEPINRRGLNASSFGENNIILQGELIGPGIQKNPFGMDKLEFFIFNIIGDLGYYNYKTMIDFLEYHTKYNFRMVPVEEQYVKFNYTLDDLLKKADGAYPSGKPKEGIVIRPVVAEKTQTLDWGLLSTKVLNNNYLLKEK